ncbi:MAG: bifunctional phosphoribosylaminoimidazolecarboxamide formyltransferase/IMP cyclohydrolase, partial [Pirellulales bacterium]
MTSPKIQRALISVSDKMGIADFAAALVAADVELYSTGGTRLHLEEAGLPVVDIAAYTGFPEMMDGRLKTLHPLVHGGILCRHDREEDRAAMQQHGILSFELVVVNLYPFQATLDKLGERHGPVAGWPTAAIDAAIEQIDIGGPTMVRAAAKNHRFTTIATDAGQYASIVEQVAAGGATTPELRRELAGQAFAKTAAYDRAIMEFFAEVGSEGPFPAVLSENLTRKTVLRYGENPHQAAALYVEPGAKGPNLVGARQLNGKELSYNNLLDLDAALAMVRLLDPPSCVVLKHNNPCGAASA